MAETHAWFEFVLSHLRVSPLWLGVILVAANPRRAMPT
jgi:hypothetical protein